MPDLRPLDRVRSIKVKLGLLVAASVSASALVSWFGLLELGWLPRYTLPVAVLLALAVTQLLAHGMTSPLRELTVAARAMAGGDYTRRVRATSRDEVGEAARAFNRMAEDLAAVDRQRRELVANVSHELRTPITALRAVLENLVDDVTPPDRATLEGALAQTDRLGRLVTELLDLSRIDAGAVPLTRADVDVAAVLGAAVREAELTGRPVRFATSVRPPGLTAYADPERLSQVVANLLDNAARHSPPGGVVTVVAGTAGDRVRLEVADDGPGILAADRERVFERFTTGGTGAGGDRPGGGGAGGRSADGGTGLGLAIARWAVELHGGRIGVVPAATGCRLWLELPGRRL